MRLTPRHPVRLVLLSVLAALSAPSLWAQRQTAELRLRVSDPAGLPILAKARLENPVTQTRLNVSLYQDGSFTFKDLAFGSYRLTVEQPGFQTFSETIELRSELRVSRDVTLAIAAAGAS